MAFTSDQLDALETAIAQGALSVRFSQVGRAHAFRARHFHVEMYEWHWRNQSEFSSGSQAPALIVIHKCLPAFGSHCNSWRSGSA